MAYEGLNFTYDGIPSQKYGLCFASFDSSNWKYVGGSENELVTDQASRSMKHTLLAVKPSVVLTFDVELLAEHPLNRYEISAIHTWLCGQQQYKKLTVQSPEYSGLHFNCVFNAPNDYFIQDGANGFGMKVICDSGGAWSNTISKSYTPTSGATVVFNNTSASNEYLYPTVEFTLSGGTEFSILNTTDSATRTFAFTGLTDGEKITVNGTTGEITSSLGNNRIDKFNKKFLRLKRGANSLTCTGNVSSLKLTYENFIRIGG